MGHTEAVNGFPVNSLLDLLLDVVVYDGVRLAHDPAMSRQTNPAARVVRYSPAHASVPIGRRSVQPFRKNSRVPAAATAPMRGQVIRSVRTPFVPRQESDKKTVAKSFVQSGEANSPVERSKFSRIVSTTASVSCRSRKAA